MNTFNILQFCFFDHVAARQTHFNLTAKTAKRLRGYLIRLTREYTDGGMDSRAELNSGFCEKALYFVSPKIGQYQTYETFCMYLAI